MLVSVCPSCGIEIDFGLLPQLGQRIDCPSCDAILRVAWLDPLEIDWMYDDEEEELDEFETYEEEEDPFVPEDEELFNEEEDIF